MPPLQHRDTISYDDLMRRVQAGDNRAFDELYDRLAPAARAQARTILWHHPDRVDEAVQEAFLSIWRARTEYRAGRGGVRTWALSIVRHRAVDLLRHYGTGDRRRSVMDRVAEDLHDPGDLVAEWVAREEAHDLRVAISLLPAEQREAIRLSFFEHLTHVQIAEQLVLPLGTVKGRIRHGLDKLARHYDTQYVNADAAGHALELSATA